MQQEKKYMLTGFLGTVAFHLLILVAFLSFKLGEARSKHKDQIAIEFSEEEYKTIEQIIEQSKPKNTDIVPLPEQTIQNIASNTAEKITEQISTEKYINDVMKELGIDDMNPKYDNTLPEETAVQTEQKKEIKKEKSVYNLGPSRVSYELSDKRSHRYMERPIYKCQGGGTVVVKIVIDQSGTVLETKIASSTAVDDCLVEAALTSANAWVFQSNYNSPKRVEGTITYMFVAQ